MRNFKRLLPVLLVSILLAGVALARPAGVVRSSNSRLLTVSKSYAGQGQENPRLYFGTVVRDTADGHSIEPGRRQVSPEAPLWISILPWTWFGMLALR